MSSLKHVAPRREHRERAQPRGREHLGLLEKHKDYKERSRNFHSKQARLTTLRRKAKERNPDEFYFGMQSSKSKVCLWTFKFDMNLFDACMLCARFAPQPTFAANVTGSRDAIPAGWRSREGRTARTASQGND